MKKVIILRNFNISYNGIDVTEYAKGEQVEVNDAQLQKLIDNGVVEIVEQKVIKPGVKKIIEPTAKKSKKSDK